MAEPARQDLPQEAPQEAPKLKGQWSPEGLSLGEMEKKGFESGHEALTGKKLELDKNVEEASSSFKETMGSWWQKTKSAFSRAKSWVRNEEAIRKLDEHVESLKAGYRKKADAAVASETVPDNVIDLAAERAKREQAPAVAAAEQAPKPAEVRPETLSRDELLQRETELSARYDELAQTVAEEGAEESKAMKAALKSGVMPEATEAGKNLNATYAALNRVRAELAKPKPAAEAEEAAAPETASAAEEEPGPGDVRYEAKKLADEAQAYAQSIDPELRVEATNADVQPEGAEKPVSMHVLRVSHQKYPEVTWVVPLGGRTPKDVLDQLESSLPKVYAQKMRKVAERLGTGAGATAAEAPVAEEEPFTPEELAELKAGGEKLAAERQETESPEGVVSGETEAKEPAAEPAAEPSVIVAEEPAPEASKKKPASPREVYPDLPVPEPGSVPPGVPEIKPRKEAPAEKPKEEPKSEEKPATEAPKQAEKEPALNDLEPPAPMSEIVNALKAAGKDKNGKFATPASFLQALEKAGYKLHIDADPDAPKKLHDAYKKALKGKK